MEGAELNDQENNCVDRLILYLDGNLITLNSQLNPDNFDRTLTIIFDKTSQIIYDLVQNGMEVNQHNFQCNSNEKNVMW